MRRMLRRFFQLFLPREIRNRPRSMPLKRAFQYYFFQRILRVNSHVPWFVHWSSAVTHPHRIVRASPERPWVGGSIGQYIQAQNGIHFGRNVRLAPGVKIISANHDPLDFDRHLTGPPITIGNDCWIGANAVILPGVQLGDHVIVGAGAVVSKSFPGDCIIGGVPARVIRELEAYAGPSPAIVEFDELGQAC